MSIKGWNIALMGAFTVGCAHNPTISKDLSTAEIRQPAAATEAPGYQESFERHQVQNVERGAEALAIRLQMINRASRSIDITTWDFTPDRSGRLLLQALVRKAHEGVHIRILVDGTAELGNVNLVPSLAHVLHQDSPGIEVRYYNTLPAGKSSLVPHHLHQKVMIIDDQEIIVGGRNLTDDYFDLNAGQHGYRDRDVWIQGPIAPVATKSFENFWSHPLSQTTLAAFGDMSLYSNELLETAKDVLVRRGEDDDLEAKINVEAKTQFRPQHEVHHVAFFADAAGAGMSKPMSRYSRSGISRELEKKHKSILIENFDFEPDMYINGALKTFQKNGGALTVVTNSYITETDPTLAHLNLSSLQGVSARFGMAYVYSGKTTEPQPFDKPQYWGIHGKSMVIDGKDVICSSFNLDSLSSYSNAEVGVEIFDSPELAQEVKDGIQEHIMNSWIVKPDGSYRQNAFSPPPPEKLGGTLTQELKKQIMLRLK